MNDSINGTTSIPIPEVVTVRDLADLLEASPIAVIKQLMANGVIANINQQIDYETAAIVAAEMGHVVTPAVAEDDASDDATDAADDVEDDADDADDDADDMEESTSTGKNAGYKPVKESIKKIKQNRILAESKLRSRFKTLANIKK